MTIKVITVPTQEDIARFVAGKKPSIIIEHVFETPAAVAAYRDGINGIQDEFDELDELLVVEAVVQFEINGKREEVTLQSQSEALAFRHGLEDAEGFVNPLVLVEGGADFEKLVALYA